MKNIRNENAKLAEEVVSVPYGIWLINSKWHEYELSRFTDSLALFHQ